MQGTPYGGGRRAKGARRIDELLTAAEDLLTRRGLEGLSLRAVADAVGISVGNLQYYFPTRAALVDAVFRRHADLFSDELAALTDPAADARDRLDTLVDYWLGVQDTRGQSLFWHLSAISPFDDAARDVMEEVYRTLPRRMAGWIREIHPAIGAGDALRRATAIAAIVEGSGLFVGFGRRPDRGLAKLRDEVRTVVATIVDRPVA